MKIIFPAKYNHFYAFFFTFVSFGSKLATFSSKVATFELEVASFASILASFSSSCDKICDKARDTAIFTANITAIICYIAWVQSPFMKEAKNDLCLAKRQSRAREHPFSREQAKNIYFAI